MITKRQHQVWRVLNRCAEVALDRHLARWGDIPHDRAGYDALNTAISRRARGYLASDPLILTLRRSGRERGKRAG